MTGVLQTDRVRLREFTEDDLDALAPMVADPEQMRFYPAPRTRSEALAWIESNLGLYERHGFGMWFMEWIETGDFAGCCGIRPQVQLGEIEIGWHTHKGFWNRGVTTEVALACRNFAFEHHQIARLVALIDPGNLASIRVAEKIGMRGGQTILLEGWPHMIYATVRP